MLMLTSLEAQRFWNKVDKTETCWLWTGCKTGAGYGMVRVRKVAYYVHRLSLEWKIGDTLTSSMYACHRCDVPNCLNPDHLFAGTNADNQNDCLQKGRHASGREYDKQYGERAPFAKLTYAQVRQIRNEYTLGGTTHRRLALQYGVSHSAIGTLLRFESWPAEVVALHDGQMLDRITEQVKAAELAGGVR